MIGAIVHRLYYSPGACSLAVHPMSRNSAPRFVIKYADPEYLAINPKGRVPALTNVPGNRCGASDLLTELPAILSSAPLFGRSLNLS